MVVKLNENACNKSPRCMMVSLCPADAITVKEGEYPVVDQETCMDCGQCVNACPHQALYML